MPSRSLYNFGGKLYGTLDKRLRDRKNLQIKQEYLFNNYFEMKAKKRVQIC